MTLRWAMWLLLLAAWSIGYGEWRGVRLAGDSAVGLGSFHLLMGERFFVAKAASGPLMSFLGLRSQPAPGTEVWVIACSPGRKIWMEAVVFTSVLDIWVLKNLRRSLSLSPTWLQYGPLELGGETVTPNPC